MTIYRAVIHGYSDYAARSPLASKIAFNQDYFHDVFDTDNLRLEEYLIKTVEYAKRKIEVECENLSVMKLSQHTISTALISCETGRLVAGVAVTTYPPLTIAYDTENLFAAIMRMCLSEENEHNQSRVDWDTFIFKYQALHSTSDEAGLSHILNL